MMEDRMMEGKELLPERTFKLKLSEKECDALLQRALIAGLTVPELLERFVDDLTGNLIRHPSRTDMERGARNAAMHWLGFHGWDIHRDESFAEYLASALSLRAAVEAVEFLEDCLDDWASAENEEVQELGGAAKFFLARLRNVYREYKDWAELNDFTPQSWENALKSLEGPRKQLDAWQREEAELETRRKEKEAETHERARVREAVGGSAVQAGYGESDGASGNAGGGEKQ